MFATRGMLAKVQMFDNPRHRERSHMTKKQEQVLSSPHEAPEHAREWVQQAHKQGWVVRKARNGHLRWMPPGRRPLTTSLTPSEYRTTKNERTRLRRAGLKV